jgi:WhiB family transcriptional regulator, redox-sensing transcriptional regulator
MHTTTSLHDGLTPAPETMVRQPVPLGAWIRRGACTSSDPAVFFPVGSDPAAAAAAAAAAKAVCDSCRVRQECLDYALEAREESGIWGGLDEAERRSLARRRQRAAAKRDAA